MSPAGPQVSVIVSVHNAASTLPELLDSLACQVYEEPYEVIVSDDASTDASVAVARGGARDLRIRIHQSLTHRGAGPARNAGAALAKAPILAFCDADDVVHEGWLRALCAAARVHPLVAGAVHHLDAPDERIDPDGLTAYYGHLPWSVTANLAVRRDVFHAVGGFLESLSTCEDADLCWRIAALGLELGYEPSAIVFKRHPLGAVPTFRQYLRYGHGHPLLFRRHRHAGMPRLTPSQAVRRYGETAAVTARALRHPRSPTSVLAAARLGQDLGRVIGSVRWRSLYL
jgi:glycosyltransferase involved in cell wall biosynthesis